MPKHSFNPAKLDRTILNESGVLRVSTGPLPAELMIAAFGRQTLLTVPAKFVIDARGQGAIHAEVPNHLSWTECTKLAKQALDSALLVIDEFSRERDTAGGARRGSSSNSSSKKKAKNKSKSRKNGRRDISPEASPETIDPADLEAALETFSWNVRPSGDNSFQIYVSVAAGSAARILLEARGAVLYAHTSTQVRAGSDLAYPALARFALETNARTRLARMSVVREGEDALRVSWEAVLPAGLPLQKGIEAIVEAVAHAHAVARRSVKALGTRQIAALFLKLRPDASQDEVPQPKAAGA